MNAISKIILIFSLSAIFLVVNGTFNHKYQQPLAQTVQPINMSDLSNLKGQIVSIQNNASNHPDWIVTGRWKIFPVSSDPQSNGSSTSETVNFNASLTMASVDGKDSHRHRLTDFSQTNIAMENGNAVINGTISMVTLGYDRGDLNNNITDIPISIKIMNLKTMSFDLNNNDFRKIFGNSPIYAKVN